MKKLSLIIWRMNENVLIFNLLFTLQENIPIKEVFENLKCTEEGLNSAEVEKRLNVFGHNKLEEKKVSHLQYNPFPPWRNSSNLYLNIYIFPPHIWQESKILKFLGFMWNPLSWVMEAAAIMALFLPHGKVDYFVLATNLH